ncbi:cytochrome c family protein [Leptolyngbya sp. 15MV]|nr:cytochrome c family protein [Leptolyngbya sp. 15MV]
MATVLLAACGGGSSEPAGDAPATDAAAPPAPAAATTPAAAPAVDNVETIDGTTLAQFTADATKGQRIFLQCQSCHVRDPGVNRIGPSLAGIVGRAAGTIDGYQYTDANKNSGITWSPEKMFQYLENPQRVVPGTKMAFAGLPNGQDRADLIAFLQTE